MTVTLIIREPWSPLEDWLSTPAKRRDLALYLAGLRLARFRGMDEYIHATLARLAGHLTAEQRELAFETLIDALRERGTADEHEIDRACARVDDAVADLCEVPS